MMVIKRLSAARRDGDKIHAIIRGCGASSDGASSGIYTPVTLGQETAIRRTYVRSGIDPGTVTLVEGHGTGTSRGDEVELTALMNVFSGPEEDKRFVAKKGVVPESKDVKTGEGILSKAAGGFSQHTPAANQQIAVGSIKSQIGHLKATAGFAGLLKVILALKHKVIPRTINVGTPCERVDLVSSPLYVNTKPRPWFQSYCPITQQENGEVKYCPRRAGISAFGFGGTNWHAIVEEAEAENTEAYRLHTVPAAILICPENGDIKGFVEAALKKLEGSDKKLFFNSFKNENKVRKIPAKLPRLGFVCVDAKDCVRVLSSFLKNYEKKENPLLENTFFYRPSAFVTGDKKVAAVFTGAGIKRPTLDFSFNRVWMFISFSRDLV
jgi:acyl transferase domain-containing protein